VNGDASLAAASPFDSDYSPHPCNQGAAGFTRCPVAPHSSKNIDAAQATAQDS